MRTRGELMARVHESVENVGGHVEHLAERSVLSSGERSPIGWILLTTVPIVLAIILPELLAEVGSLQMPSVLGLIILRWGVVSLLAYNLITLKRLSFLQRLIMWLLMVGVLLNYAMSLYSTVPLTFNYFMLMLGVGLMAWTIGWRNSALARWQVCVKDLMLSGADREHLIEELERTLDELRES